MQCLLALLINSINDVRKNVFLLSEGGYEIVKLFLFSYKRSLFVRDKYLYNVVKVSYSILFLLNIYCNISYLIPQKIKIQYFFSIIIV